MNNSENNEIILNLLYNLSEKIILNVETKLFNTFNKMIEDKFLQNTIINLCYLTYNEIFTCMVTKSINELIENFIEIQKIFPHDLLCLLKISFEITINLMKNLNRSQYNFSSYNKLVNSIENQIELIKNIKFDIFFKLIQDHECSDTIDTYDSNKKYFLK